MEQEYIIEENQILKTTAPEVVEDISKETKEVQANIDAYEKNIADTKQLIIDSKANLKLYEEKLTMFKENLNQLTNLQ